MSARLLQRHSSRESTHDLRRKSRLALPTLAQVTEVVLDARDQTWQTGQAELSFLNPQPPSKEGQLVSPVKRQTRNRRSVEVVALLLLTATLVAYAAAPKWLIPHMRPSEKLAFFVFLGSVATVYVTAAWMICASIAARLGARRQTVHPTSLRLRVAIFSLAGLGIACMAYGYFIEPYWPAVDHLRITSPKLLKATRPIRIVQLSDLHSDPKPRLEDSLPDLVAAEKPDLIVFTGDAANSPAGLPIFRRCLTRVARLAPTFAVRGNFDVLTWPKLDFFGGTGVQELDGDAVEIEISGVRLWIAGVALTHEDRIDRTLAQIPSDAFTVFLYHTPDRIEEVARYPVDLYLAGHTHGGQVALPFYGALVVLSSYGKRFESGLHRVGGTWLYVNRGIGMEGFSAPRVRFCARPEITVVELIPPR